MTGGPDQPPHAAGASGATAEAQLNREIRLVGRDPMSWIRARQAEQRLYGPAKAHDGATAPMKFETQCTETMAGAKKILAHEFDLLGSGPFVPDDPDRPPRADGYRPIDWSLDPVSGLRFPMNIAHTDWDLYAMRPGMADIKLPWELARCQHWITLAQAYRLSGDDIYAFEIACQMSDFVEANPVGTGINWTCTMDVAIRALNWALSLEWIALAGFGDAAFWRHANAALYEHGRFIFENLEDKYEVTSNHFLSNVVGLYYLARWFSDLSSGETWRAFCRNALETEIATQVLDDGADFESSVPYHRLVTELFLGAARLAEHADEPLSQAYRRRLSSMVDYLMGVLRPDGLMPQCGDADDGRLHIFTRYDGWVRQDPGHLFAPAAMMLNRRAWLDQAGEDGAWEAYWWGYETAQDMAAKSPPPAAFSLFEDAGHAVYRDDLVYLLVTNSIVGTKGFGNHKHNDQLAFEFHTDGAALFVDPGSHVYTADPDSRNLFRSTEYHNALEIDGTEQNETNPEWIFRMMDSGRPTHLSFERDERTVEYRGRHVGYERLDNPVIHDRAFRLFPDDRALLIADTVFGYGDHTLRWHFHADPEICVRPDSASGSGIAFLEHGSRTFGLASLERVPVLSATGYYSPGYGAKRQCPTFDFHARARLQGRDTWIFVIAPVEWMAGDRAVEAIGRFSEETSRASSP